MALCVLMISRRLKVLRIVVTEELPRQAPIGRQMLYMAQRIDPLTDRYPDVATILPNAL